MAQLSISLLGRFRVTHDEQPIVTFESDRVRVLLAYLAVEVDRVHDRSTLAGLLWPDQSEPAARANLRHVLLNLRHAIGDAQASPPFLLITHQTIQWNPASDTWLDVALFVQLMAACAAHLHRRMEDCTACIDRLQQAVALYQGNFLAGITLPDSIEVEEWVRITQERLHRQVLQALYHLASYHEARTEYDDAARHAQRQVELEPWREEAHRQLMRILALAGRRSEALAQFTVCQRILTNELAVEPSLETMELYERIKTGRFPSASDSAPLTAPQIVTAHQPAHARHNLPPDFNAFIGRSAERDEIHARLNQPYCRLVTLVGPGGAGKTRLAIAAARERLTEYADGVWFVPLAGVTAQSAESLTNTIATAIAGSIGLQLSSAAEPLAQLRSHLSSKHMLLVLDNFEHLSDGVDVIHDIVEHAPHVQLLVTSRRVLNLQSEWLIEVAGLPFPANELAQDRAAETQPAVVLFEERRKQVQPRPIDTPEERTAIRRICRLVEGMPLAIELAASLTRTVRCSTIAATLTHNLGDLTTTLHDIPARQRSLRAVFEASWQQLTVDEQALLAQLSVFRGGFTIEAASHVAQATSATLRALQDKSFLHQPQMGRYTLHEVLRFFASEKLAELATTQNSLALIAERHSAYYLSRVSNYTTTLGGAHSQQAVQDIWSDLDNVRQAWQWVIDQPDLATLRRCQSALILFYRLAGLLHEGAAVLAHAIERLQSLITHVPEPSAEIKIVLNRLYIEQSHFFRRLGQYAPALEAAHEAIRLAQAANNAAGEAGARYVAGLVLWYQANFEAAQQQAAEALQLYRQLPDPLGESRIYNLLGLIMDQTGHYAAAEAYFEQALAISRSIGDRLGEALELANLGTISGEQGDYGRERACYIEAQPIEQQSSEPRLYADTLCDLGYNSYMLGEHAHALACYEQSLAIMRSTGDRAWESVVLLRMGMLFQRLDELDRARDQYRQALTIARSIGHRDYEGAALAQLGHLCAADRKWNEARAYYREALVLRQALGQPQCLPELHAGLAWIAAQQSEVEQAKAHLDSIIRDLETNRTLAGAVEPLRILFTCYNSLKALADDRAREILERAYRLLQEQAARIADEPLRHSFLHNVPAHQAIRAAWTNARKK